MIPVETARQKILACVEALPAEKIPIQNALGRYLERDILSPFDIPLLDNSAMDGYAVRAEDCTAAPQTLKVIYDLPAGALPERALAPGEAVRIMTGAPLPAGADTVVMRERTAEEPAAVTLQIVPARGDNLRLRGEDIRQGEVVLEGGSLIGPAQIGVLASIKQSLVYVRQRPVVAVLSTGDEIADLDESFEPGKVMASNSYTLTNLIESLGAVPLYLGIARDNRADLESKIARARRADLLLTSGGVSMGDYDLVKDIMTSGDNRMEFWQVEMKPGKPLAFGRLAGIPAIGLPGNPVSSMISFYQFARPAILKMMGARQLLLPRVSARLQNQIRKKADRPNYIRGVLCRKDDVLQVRSTGPQGSGILTSMAMSNCFILLPKEMTQANPGDTVTCEVFQSTW